MNIDCMETDYIEIDRAPAIAGLKFQRFCGAADFPKILAVIKDCTERDEIERVPTLTELAEYSIVRTDLWSQ
jgi:hypothetical protein